MSLPRVVTSPFYPLKLAKNVLGTINNNFHFFAFLKSFSVLPPPPPHTPSNGLIRPLTCVDVAYVL